MVETEMDREACPQHPAALSASARAGIAVKHVATKALKYGVIAGVAGAGLCALAPAIVLGSLALGVGVFSSSAAATVAAPVAMAALAGAKVFGIGGAALGGAVGLGGVSKAVNAEEERRICRYERAAARQERLEALAHRRDMQRLALAQQSRAFDLTPNPALPHRRPQQKLVAA